MYTDISLRRPPSRHSWIRGMIGTLILGLCIAVSLPPLAHSSGVLEKWALQMPPGSFPVLGEDGAVYVVSGKRLLKMDPQTGTTAWSYYVGGEINGGIVTASATVGSTGAVFVVTPSASLYALDPRNGEVRWELQAGRSLFLGYPARTLSKAGLVFLPAGEGALNAVDVESGELRWRFDMPRNSRFSGVSFNSHGQMVFGDLNGSDNSGSVHCLDVATGHIKWQYTLPSNTAVITTPAVSPDGTIFVTTDAGRLYALDGATGAKRWEFAIDNPRVSLTAPILDAQGLVFFGTSFGQLYAVDTRTHSLKWKTPSANTNVVVQDPTLASDGLLCWPTGDGAKNTGVLSGIDRETGSTSWSLPLHGYPVSPAVTGNEGAIYISDGAGQVLALVSGQVTRATATVTAQTFNGFVVGATIRSAGAGYTNTPNVTVIGGGGNGAILTARVLDGAVVGVDVFDAGRGYTNTPKLLIDPPVPYPAPSKAVATLAGGVVSGVVVLEPGYGYGTPPPHVSFVGGGGEGAVGMAVVQNGAVIGIEMISGGSGYTSAPVVQIQSPEGLSFVTIGVSSVEVNLHVTPGFIYQLQTSPDSQTWSNVGIPFLAVDTVAHRTFDVGTEKEFYRLVTIP